MSKKEVILIILLAVIICLQGMLLINLNAAINKVEGSYEGVQSMIDYNMGKQNRALELLDEINAKLDGK